MFFVLLHLFSKCVKMQTAIHTDGEAKFLKYFPQFVIILAFSLLGELLQALIPLPSPASIYGMVLLFLALCTGLLKQEKVAVAADWLISVMPVLFIAPAANILAHFDLIAPDLLSIVAILVLSTFVIFSVAGLVTRLLIRKGENKDA